MEGGYVPSRDTLENREEFIQDITECFKGVACVSENTYNQVIQFHKNAVVVNHLIPIDEYKQKSIPAVRCKKYLFLGSLSERKNILMTIDWFIKCSDTTSLYIAGKGELTKSVKEAANNNENVHYLGKLSKDEIKRTLKEYDFLILPSEEEPYGVVLLEALAAGVPCLVSNAIGPAEIITNGYNGFVFDITQDKEQNFSLMMQHSLKMDNEGYSKLVSNALDSAKKYDVKEAVKRWISLFNTLD